MYVNIWLQLYLNVKVEYNKKGWFFNLTFWSCRPHWGLEQDLDICPEELIPPSLRFQLSENCVCSFSLCLLQRERGHTELNTKPPLQLSWSSDTVCLLHSILLWVRALCPWLLYTDPLSLSCIHVLQVPRHCLMRFCGPDYPALCTHSHRVQIKCV